MSQEMIRVSGLFKEYPGGVKALQDVAFRVGRGEFVVLLGLSGAGKSTLLRCLNGLVHPDAGKVTVGGLPVNGQGGELRLLRRKVGMIFQQFNLVKRLSVLENVLCGRLGYCGIFSSCCRVFSLEDKRLAWEALERVRLREKASARADQLSGGQQQRVGIARALVQQPEVLLADEPVASLDPKSAKTIMDILTGINQEDGLTVVASLHDVEFALKYAHRIIGLQAGRVVLDKPVDDIQDADLEYLYQEERGRSLEVA